MNDTTVSTKNPQLRTRYEMAMKELRRNKIVARRNITTCCRGCYDANVADDQPIIWHYGGQGYYVDLYETGAWYRYVPAYRNDVVDVMYFNHDNLTCADGLTPAGQTVVDVFEKYGLVIKWDRTGSDCIQLLIKESLEAEAPALLAIA